MTKKKKKKNDINRLILDRKWQVIIIKICPIRCERLDLAEHFRSMAEDCNSWKKTYWRAWSECHFLSCATCEQMYPVSRSAMCQYHPEEPEYFPLGSICLQNPIGECTTTCLLDHFSNNTKYKNDFLKQIILITMQRQFTQSLGGYT